MKIDHIIKPNIKGYAFGHFGDSSSHVGLDSIHPRPGKKSERYNVSARFTEIQTKMRKS